jgi:release factor glutamine methyltransferase
MAFLSVQKALSQGAALLRDASVSAPRLTAEVLLAHAMGRDRTWFYAHSEEELREVHWIHYGRYLHERMQGKPAQYITRQQEFYGRDFSVSPAVLIPRPETELVVEAALEKLHVGAKALDVGTGSGAIAATLALETGAKVTATDVSSAALAVAAANIQRLDAAVDLVACDLAAPFAEASFHVVVSNLPYIPESESATLAPEVREFEPHLALFGGPDGLALYRRLIPQARNILLPGGWLILELAWNRSEDVVRLLTGWKDIEVRPDLAGLPRILLARC